LVAGLLIGQVEALTALLIEPSLKQVGMFAIYLLVLMFRPRGLFGTL
jgi:branched-chain amino acid transport system permease protein